MKNISQRNWNSSLWAAVAVLVLAGCSPSPKESADKGAGTTGEASSSGSKKTLVLAAYSTPKEAYQQDIIPAFQKFWKAKSGEDVEFQQTYEASGTQARNVVGGLDADIVALSLEGDVEKIKKAGLITGDWKKGSHGGMVTDSVVVIAARTGNPKQIHDWADLTKPDVKVLTPNPKTSGGAKWNVLGVYGAGLRAKDAEAAYALIKGVRANIESMDKSGRESFSNFENGVGDAAITYENEALRAMEGGRKYDLILPPATLLIENPAAVVDKNADKHGVREVADAFVAYLTSAEAQRAFAKHHYRPVDETVAKEFAAQYPKPVKLFTIQDLGGWKKLETDVFGPGGAWTRADQEVGAGKP